MTPIQEHFVNELVKQRGIKRAVSLLIVNMDMSMKHEMLVALKDAYEKGQASK